MNYTLFSKKAKALQHIIYPKEYQLCLDILNSFKRIENVFSFDGDVINYTVIEKAHKSLGFTISHEFIIKFLTPDVFNQYNTEAISSYLSTMLSLDVLVSIKQVYGGYEVTISIITE